MAFFNFGKKKEEKKVPTCCCASENQAEETVSCCCGAAPKTEESGCCCGSSRKEAESGCCCGGSNQGICCIKVLGAGCKSCHDQYEFVQKAVESMGLNVEVSYITDMEKVMEYSVMSMPAIVINEKVVSMGKVLKTADVEKLLKKYLG